MYRVGISLSLRGKTNPPQISEYRMRNEQFDIGRLSRPEWVQALRYLFETGEDDSGQIVLYTNCYMDDEVIMERI
jgi:hypothetical protein|tara:strand:- start:5003 stop:5227 length:225 start_codon:yes stop_codon:yes gene_type:complete